MWDIWQDIKLVESDVQQAQTDGKVDRVQSETVQLQRQIDKMALVSQALFELLKEKTGITDAELRRKIREVDQRDGFEDSKVSGKPLKCPKCGGVVTVGALKCQTCAATIAPRYPYEK